jgi:hypothetical protein
MIFTKFAVEKKSNIFSRGRGETTSSLKRKNEKNYCLTNLNILSEERGTEHYKNTTKKETVILLKQPLYYWTIMILYLKKGIVQKLLSSNINMRLTFDCIVSHLNKIIAYKETLRPL